MQTYKDTVVREIKIIHIGDFHLGARDNLEDFYNYEVIPLFEKIEKIAKAPEGLDAIVFSGDFFDKINKYDSPIVGMSNDIILNLCKMASAYSFHIFIQKGTESHDGNQLASLAVFKDSGYPITLMQTITFIDYKGFIIRFIPEPYMGSYEEFKTIAYSAPADITFFHGTVTGVNDMIDKSYKNPTNRVRDIHIDAKEMMDNTNFYATGSHIHKRLSVMDNCWYVGSYSANNYGDANDYSHGFDYIVAKELMDVHRNRFKDIKIYFNKNEGSLRFTTEDITNIIESRTLNELKAILYAKLKSLNIDTDRYRFDIDLSKLSQDGIYKANTLKSIFATNFDFKLSRKQINIVDALKKSIDEDSSFILDTSVSAFDKIMYALDEMKSAEDDKITLETLDRLTKDRVKHLLETDIDEIMK